MSAANSTPTQGRLKELLNYEASSGVFTWRVNRCNVKAGDVTGCKAKNGYLLIRVDRKAYLAHRLAWCYVHGQGSVPSLIDHKNGIKTDNSIDNLRQGTKVTNGQNRHAAQANNKSSGLLGVAYIAHTGKFMASISKGGKCKYLGLFVRKEDAHEAYLLAKRTAHEGCTI